MLLMYILRGSLEWASSSRKCSNAKAEAFSNIIYVFKFFLALVSKNKALFVKTLNQIFILPLE